MSPEEIKSKFEELEAKFNANNRVDNALQKPADFLSSKLKPLGWLGKLSAFLPWWLEVLLILALLILCFWAVNSFADWRADRKAKAETARYEAELSAAKEKAAKTESGYRTLISEYSAIRDAATSADADAKRQADTVSAQAKRTVAASENYARAVKNPVAVVTIDATSDKTLEASLIRLTDAVKTSMERAK